MEPRPGLASRRGLESDVSCELIEGVLKRYD
jgi:hypothetical protein